MSQWRWVSLVWLVGCATPAAPEPTALKPPVPAVDVAPDWIIVHEAADHLVLRWRDSADGVRIQLARHAGYEVGVSPVVGGVTYALRDGSHSVPMFAPAYPAHPLTNAIIERKGPDLLIRLEGAPLSLLSPREGVPDDPMLAWVRIRHRGDSLRLVARGLFVWTLPASGLEHKAEGLNRRTQTSDWGTFVWNDTALPVWHSSIQQDRWTLDTTPTLSLNEPYTRVGITWRPDRGP